MRPSQTFGQLLRSLFVDSGRTIVSIADTCGVTKRTLHNYCSDRTVPGPEMVKALARVMGLSPVELEAEVQRRRNGRPRIT